MKKPISILLACLCIIGGAVGMNALWAGVTNQDVSASRPIQSAADSSAADSSQAVCELAMERPAPLASGGELILQKSQYLISYNPDRKCPNYVCWQLTPERARGRVQRSNDFHSEQGLEESVRIDPFDYNGSGYDRGHLCPAGDNKNSVAAMHESFSMANICPQDGELNAGAWNDLENKCREWVRRYGDTLYICCGPIYDSDKPKTIGRRKNFRISVPDRFFKVVLLLRHKPRAIGFVYPNRRCGGEMRDYAVSVDEVERVTGYDFFYQLADSAEDKLESVCNPEAWGM